MTPERILEIRGIIRADCEHEDWFDAVDSLLAAISPPKTIEDCERSIGAPRFEGSLGIYEECIAREYFFHEGYGKWSRLKAAHRAWISDRVEAWLTGEPIEHVNDPPEHV